MAGKTGAVIGVMVFAILAFASSAQATFPGANGKIAFTGGDTVGGFLRIYTVNPDGTDLFTVALPGVTPGWSPNGTKLAYADQYGAQQGLHVINPDGTANTTLGSFDSTYQPSWSPDGKTIAFTHSCDIWLINIDGTGERNLTNTNPACTTVVDQESGAVWSPDGSRIAFHRFDRTGNTEIFTMKPDGTDQVNVTRHPADDYSVDWSPDGSKFVFQSYRDIPPGGGFPPPNPEIYTMNADGTDQRNVTNNPGYDGDPGWSPDGTKIVWISSQPNSGLGRSNGLYFMNADGSDVKPVPTPLYPMHPAWQPVPSTTPGPQRGDYKNAAQFCKALRDYLGEAEFSQRYKNHGKCVSSNP